MKANKNGKRILIVLSVLLIVLLCFAIAAGAAVMYFSSKLNRDNIENGAESIKSMVVSLLKGGSDEDAVSNILLIGVDNDNLPGMNDLGNADGLIIVSINKNTKQIVLSSLMRDIKVELPDGGHTKITLSYHQGGVPLLLETVENNFAIDIDNYVLVNYMDVVQIVDSVGGITLDVSADELYHMQSKIENINSLVGQPAGANMIDPANAGELRLNGVQAAAYMRIRMAGNNDQERTERARRVLLELKDSAMEMNLSQLKDFANTALPCITTDMASSDILSMLMSVAGYKDYEIVSQKIPVEGSYYYSTDGNSYVVIDYDVNRAQLYQSIYEGASE